MLVLCYEIKIGAYTLKDIESITVNSSADMLSDTCTITLPGMVYNKPYALEDKIKRGDAVLARMGYNNELRDEFKGYLKSIHPNAPMKLECEDSAFLFRKSISNKQFKKTSAAKIARYILDEVNKQLPAAQKMKLITDIKSSVLYETFTIIASNGYQALETLRSESGMQIYCRGRELHVHLASTKKTGEATYDFTRNIEASDDLEYVRAEDKKVRVVLTGGYLKKKQLKIEVGEKGGDELTIKMPKVTSQATLEKLAKQQLKKVSYDGYKGAIRGWLVPFCGIGYSARVLDPEYPQRTGTYYVSAVKTEFSKNGGVRTVTLGIKLSAPPKEVPVTVTKTELPSVSADPKPATPDEADELFDEDEGDA